MKGLPCPLSVADNLRNQKNIGKLAVSINVYTPFAYIRCAAVQSFFKSSRPFVFSYSALRWHCNAMHRIFRVSFKVGQFTFNDFPVLLKSGSSNKRSKRMNHGLPEKKMEMQLVLYVLGAQMRASHSNQNFDTKSLSKSLFSLTKLKKISY